jgi:hypothetical protein
VIAEVYALNALFVVLCLGLLFRWRTTPGGAADRWLYAFVLVYGLSFSHHLSMVLFLPAFLFLILFRNPKVFLRPPSWLVGLLAICLGLLPYVYILLRASQGADFSEFPVLGDRSLLAVFVDYVSGAQFRAGFFSAFDAGAASLMERIGFYSGILLEQFGWWGLGLGLLGLGSLAWRDPVLAGGLLIAFLGQVVFSLGYAIIDPEVYFIPSYIVWVLFIIHGIGWLVKIATTRRMILPARVLAPAVCAVIAVYPLVHNWKTADQSRNYQAGEWAQGFLHQMEDDALVVMPQPYYYSQKQILLYLQAAEAQKPGIDFIQWQAVDRYSGQRPIYLATPINEIQEEYNLKAIDSSDLRLADFVSNLADGTIVLVAAKDEASLALGEEAVAALRSVGGQADLRGCFRCGHALIGVKGAAPGTALESAGAGLHEMGLAAGQSIGDTGQSTPVRLLVRSAGLDDGDTGEIWVAGRPVSPNQRGYNLAAIDPIKGRILATANADTVYTDRVNNVRKWRVESRR